MQALFILDPYHHLELDFDSSLYLMSYLQKNDAQIYFCQVNEVFIEGNQVYAYAAKLSQAALNNPNWHQHQDKVRVKVNDLNLVFIRKDPPFDLNYLYLTQILDHAEMAGVKVVNCPQSLRNFNEKLITHYFSHLSPPTLVSAHRQALFEFVQNHQRIVIKPLDDCSGRGIFVMDKQDKNLNSLFEIMTARYQRPIVVQKYLADVNTLGDRRIILLHGKPVSHTMVRYAQNQDNRSNINAGGRAELGQLRPIEEQVCAELEPFLIKHRLYFVGLDMIGDYVTEINITSVGCLRVIAEETGQNLAKRLIEPLLN